MNFANAYLKNGGSSDQVKSLIWDGPVKSDLLYVAKNFQATSFDIWEEEQANHFYNRLVYHRAMSMCVTFATQMGDSATSSTCGSAASALVPTLSQFWDPGRKILLYATGPVQRGKSSFIDISTILGVIHGYNNDGLFSYANEQVLSTAYQIATSFLFYPVAGQHADGAGAPLGIPIGRYPEDVYTGTGTADNGGNPWFLTTAAMAEHFYRTASEIKKNGMTVTSTSLQFWTYFAPNAKIAAGTFSSGSPQVSGAIDALQGWGDAFMRLIKVHGDPAGHLSEEFNRNTGFMQGAADLTWSYASVLTAALARAEIQGDNSYATNLANLPF
jgi:glucoamylase